MWCGTSNPLTGTPSLTRTGCSFFGPRMGYDAALMTLMQTGFFYIQSRLIRSMTKESQQLTLNVS
jgi:hypothetical protein